jgi:hypothetical protein
MTTMLVLCFWIIKPFIDFSVRVDLNEALAIGSSKATAKGDREVTTKH